jgi:hypothetical protein
MDLTMFLQYHFDVKRTLSGFIASYNQIIEKGCSLDGKNFDSYIPDKDKEFLIDVVTATNFITHSENNKDISLRLHDAISRGADELLLSQVLEDISISIRHHSFYRSMHYTRVWEMQAMQAQETRLAKHEVFGERQMAVGQCPLCHEIEEEARLDLLSKWNQGIESFDFYLHFMEKHAMPAAYMPHLYRSHDFYVDYCRSSHQGYLLLSLEGNDFSDELPF